MMIDLSSDTKTRPCSAMRHAMAHAEVGDEHFAEDPTVLALIKKGCDMLGHEAALYLPSATMGNQIAIRTWCQTGDEVICHTDAHIRKYEGGGPAVLSGVLLHPLTSNNSKPGTFTPEEMLAGVRPTGPYFPPTRLVCLENTHNYAGGTVWSLEQLTTVCAAARANNLRVHLDGSRVFNAATALGIPALEITQHFDSVTLCLSKGLGAPIGALLLGKPDFIEAARRWKHTFGGAMRQSGIVAAGGLYALENNIARMHEDHVNAKKLADGLAQIPGVALSPYPETNIVYFDIAGTGLSGPEAQTRLEVAGVRSSYAAGTRLRFVTHLDISVAQIDEAIAICQRVFRI
jgi:threonine aldolase